MKKIILLFTLLSLSPGLPAFAENLSVVSEPKKTLKEDIFSVSTEDFDASDSLNRVAGNIDRGFSSPEQSFKSDEQSVPGPQGREKSALASSKSY